MSRNRKWPDGLRPVFIEWDDSSSLHGWHPKDEVEPSFKGGKICYSVGFLLKKTKKNLLILQSVSLWRYAEALKIPCHSVKRWGYLN